ncbi:MAG: HTH-type transcriptional regulator SyrM 1 [Alphaproteobacteria bacterium MarineAlpha11_Bin1]|nr:MAG: HTH-type transcriptional regulator SyrM 1 [Alphaproteobacteria bacterium MarineAlpha11_Bin1]|tara:strand:+ start:4764 stop:5669 length:906 start_codon:yes stop_codon:yes gene_type:complete
MSNIKDVDLNLLIVLNVLLDERSVSGAAKRLNLSQPAVSGALKRLREAFHDPLFVRTRQGIRPTPQALQLIGPLKSVLRDIETIFAVTDFVPETADFTFTVAATDYAQTTFLAPLINRVNAIAPGIRFSVVPTDIRRMPEQLDRQEIDIAITVPEMAPPNCLSIELFDDRYVCALDVGHLLAEQELSLDKFCELDHVLVTPSNDGFFGPTDEALKKLGRERRVSVTIPNFLSLPSILSGSDFITVAPERILRPFEGSVKIFPPPFPLPPFRMIGVWHDHSENSPAHTWFRDQIRKLAIDLG